jgi:hypothetical protein
MTSDVPPYWIDVSFDSQNQQACKATKIQQKASKKNKKQKQHVQEKESRGPRVRGLLGQVGSYVIDYTPTHLCETLSNRHVGV